jgi:small subunit ribosomal protein S12
MSTTSQLNKCLKRLTKKRSYRLRVFKGAPQKKAVCQRAYTCTPKKPNSAIRKIAKVRLSTGFSVIMYIQGEKHNLVKYSTILVRYGKAQDLPGVKFKGIRGKYDFLAPIGRTKKRSKYGVKAKKK